MRSLPALLILGLLAGASARAQDGERVADAGDVKKKKKKKKKDKDKEADNQADSEPPPVGASEANRRGKSVVIAAEIGLIDVLESGYGAEVGLFLSPNTLLEADYFTASFGLFGLQNTDTLATVRLKHFVGNSFYVHAGAGMREVTSVNNADNTIVGALGGPSSGGYYSKQTATQGVVEIGLGNRWQFGSFTLGCDWVGYAQPVSTLAHTETVTGTADPDQQQSDEDSFKKLENQGATLFVRFHLGWAF